MSRFFCLRHHPNLKPTPERRGSDTEPDRAQTGRTLTVTLKLIIDTDPGVDDAMAIFYAHAAPEINLLGLTTVFGNVFVEQATRNAIFLREMLGARFDIAQGAAEPWNLPDFEPASNVHGPEGFGDVTDIPISGSPLDENAAEYLCRMAREHQGELVVCPIGPITNIADAIRLDPDFAKNVAKIVLMGGAVDCPGNITAHAEANTYHDAEAAEIVFSSGADITIVGLDVTLKTLCDRQDFADMADASPKFGGFLNRIGPYYLNFYKETAGLDGCGLHDSTAVIAATHPHLFDMEKTGISVVTTGEELGNTVRDGSKPPVTVCTGIDDQAVTDLFFRTIRGMG